MILTKEQEKIAYEWLPAVGSALRLKATESMFFFNSLEELVDYMNHDRTRECIKHGLIHHESEQNKMFFVMNITSLGNGSGEPAVLEIAWEIPDVGKPYKPFYLPMFPPLVRGKPQVWKRALEVLSP